MGNPEPNMTRTLARNDCGHCSRGPKAVADQSSARILAPISPPPANTDSIKCVFMRSMAESLDSATAPSDMHDRIGVQNQLLYFRSSRGAILAGESAPALQGGAHRSNPRSD